MGRRRRLLSRDVEAIEYRHAGDGQPYRHDFEYGGAAAYLLDDGSVEIRNPDRRLWRDFGDKPYLVNPPKGARRMPKKKAKSTRTAARKKKRPVPAGFRSWPEYMASIRPGGTKRKRRSNPSQGATVGQKKKSSGKRRGSTARTTTKRRSSARRRRNPPGLNGLIGRLTAGVTNGGAVIVGKLGARVLPQMMGLPQAGIAGIATQLGAGIAVSMLVDRVSPRHGPFVLAGAMASIEESLLKKANIPVLSPALGDEADLLAAYPMGTPGLSAYPEVGSYPQLAGGYGGMQEMGEEPAFAGQY